MQKMKQLVRAIGLGLGLMAAAFSAAAQDTKIKFTLDW